MLRLFRHQVREVVDNYLGQHREMFTSAFDGMKEALEVGDIDGFVSNANSITRALGKRPNFETMDEFDAFMASGKTFKF